MWKRWFRDKGQKDGLGINQTALQNFLSQKCVHAPSGHVDALHQIWNPSNTFKQMKFMCTHRLKFM